MVGGGNPAAVASMRCLGGGEADAGRSRLSDKRASRNGPRHSVYWVQSHRKPSTLARPSSSTTTPTDMGANASRVEYTVTGKYTGDWLDGQKHGYGVFVYANGSKYEGDWVHDKRAGKGTQWVGGSGADKDKAKSREGKAHKQYAGDWREDKRHGEGTFFFEDGGRYDGQWARNQREGYGRMVFADHSIYEGQWLKNQRSGHGVLRLPNGDRYDGHWLHDKKEGPGRFYYRATRKVYEGEWVDGTPRCGSYHDDSERDGRVGDGDEDDGAMVGKPHDRFHIPELGLAHPERVVSESIAYIRQERLLEKAFQATQLGGEPGNGDHTGDAPEAGDSSGASVVFDEPTMRFLQQEFQSIERLDGTIQCESLPHMFEAIGLGVETDQILAFLDEIGATPATAITFAECVDILSLLAESAIGDALPEDSAGDQEGEEEVESEQEEDDEE